MKRRVLAGFSLLEMAVVLIVIGALAGGAVTPLRVQLESRDRRSTQAQLDRAVEALYGFAMQYGFLPCPADPARADGREARAADGLCRIAHGHLPWVELGVSGVDAWSTPLRYAVTTRLTGEVSGRSFTRADDGHCAADDGDLDLCEPGTLAVATRGDDPASAAQEDKHLRTLADGVPAVVWSPGANAGSVARGADERENSDGDAQYLARRYSAAQDGCADSGGEALPFCAFDDLVVWVSPTVLTVRLVSAGQLP